MRVKIAGLQPVTLIDFPDRIAATVFLAGCDLNCGYCHNRWMIDAARVPESQTVDAFFSWLETREGLLDGVCVSGGEPTVSQGLDEFLQGIKDRGFAVKLDTNGTLPDRVEALLRSDLVDYVAMDVKAPLDERYAQVAGCPIDPERIRRSMTLLREWGGDYEFRTTVEPHFTEAWLADISESIMEGEAWILQAFRVAEGISAALAEKEALSEEDLAGIAERLAKTAPGVRVRGLD